MKLIGWYVFKRMLGACLLSLGGLSGTVWLSQALRELNLITSKGQSLFTFLHVSGLIFPGLLLIVCPVAILIGVIYTLNQLNADSELVIINASGAPPTTLLKPALLLGTLGMVVVAAMSLYLVPRSLQSFRDLITNVNADLISTFVDEGSFTPIGDQLVFHIRERKPDGTMEGIFIQDEREAGQSNVYIANKGIVLKNPLGTFLVMQDGTIQQRSVAKDSMSVIQFESYAFDLSTFTSAASLPSMKPAERDTTYLLAPDPNDTEFQKRPASFPAELHDRLSNPLYTMLFAILPVLALGQAQTTRHGRGVVILGTVLAATGLRVAGLILAGLAANNPILIPALYGLPLAFIIVSLIAILRGYRFSSSEGIGSMVLEAVQRLMPRRGAAGGA
ncbi:LPS export ABC transporter permease LptF [Kaistia algarum]|uniref:LPS export ABC transporter permease LptF n=1 Tax=Kaistia algarum TaxID=2083279 RepID=UPI000CE84E99|nr:LPS export ABC transporter permease LptF [Kaistia algarum]MCX5511969.1 LPS export ABC transporter permease LptF [Kaistia algarum]PPE80100.1 LPS export ABC transporter permease LptF [Kaistia algarum]